MLCQICKVNQATIHIQEMGLDGSRRTLHLCTECAGKKAVDDPMFKDMNLPEMLLNLARDGQLPEEIVNAGLGMLKSAAGSKPEIPEAKEVVCPSCGWTGLRFKQTGLLGCARCYTVFQKEIENLLAARNRLPVHTGKRPAELRAQRNPALIRQELLRRQKNLDDAVKHENYELAAEFRDQIRHLQRELESCTGEQAVHS